MRRIYKLRLIISGFILLAAFLAFAGFYPVHFLNIQLIPLIQKTIFNCSIFVVIILSILTLSALLFGRLYCSLICPLGILQEFIYLIYLKINNNIISKAKYHKPKPYKYFIFALVFGSVFAGSSIIIKYIDPYSIFASFVSFSIYGIIIVILILSVLFFKDRFFCTSVCPVGTMLGLLSKISFFKIYLDNNCISCGLCSKNCLSKCIDIKNKTVDNENCIKCLKCISICPKNSIKYGIKLEKTKFNPNRRRAIISIGASALFISAYAAGISFSKKIYKNLKKTILPPGAKDIQKLANKCTNCNLCIVNCPMKILDKADFDYKTIHINFKKGKQYCNFNCSKCSQICPTGAIKNITLKQKQKTKIANSYINQNCIECGKCISKCPKDAISYIENSLKIDNSKCIGCGICKAVCSSNAVDIYPIEEQTEI